MRVITVKANWDNWVYIHPYQADRCWTVDPSDAATVLKSIADKGLCLTHILATHHHADHIGGIAALKKTFHCRVFSPDDRRIAGTDVRVKDGDVLKLGQWTVTVLAVPGHTTDSVCYYGTHPTEPPVLYSGDTLFSGGCGRAFECAPETLYHSLQRLAALPDETRIFPGHNYTEDNIRFALTLEPDRPALKKMIAAIRAQSAFLPTTLKQEKLINPFLRCHENSIRQAVELDDPVAVFAELRRRKDRF